MSESPGIQGGNPAVPDLSQIKPPTPAPSNEPDRNTEEEAKELKQRKTLTARQGELASNEAHVDSLWQAIKYLRDEKESLKAEIVTLRVSVNSEQTKTHNLSLRCGSLEAALPPLNCMNFLGAFMLAVGSLLLGLTSLADVPAGLKGWFSYGGAGVSVSGLLTMFAAFWSTHQSQKRPPFQANQ